MWNVNRLLEKREIFVHGDAHPEAPRCLSVIRPETRAVPRTDCVGEAASETGDRSSRRGKPKWEERFGAAGRREKGTVEMRLEISNVRDREPAEKTNKTKTWVLENASGADESLPELTGRRDGTHPPSVPGPEDEGAAGTQAAGAGERGHSDRWGGGGAESGRATRTPHTGR